MHNPEKDARAYEERRRKFMDTGYRLFSERTIEQVSLEEVAKQSGIGVATLYRYFGTKMELVIEISTEKWKEYQHEVERRLPLDRSGLTGAEEFGIYLDVYLDLYRKQPEMLRFNQFFNIFVEGTQLQPEQLEAYSGMIDGIAERFRRIWEKGGSDGTLRTDISWRQAFSSTLHIMLAAVTRYAVGLVYNPADAMAPERELMLLRDMIYREYTTGK